MPNENNCFRRDTQIKNISIKKTRRIIMINAKSNTQSFIPSTFLNI